MHPKILILHLVISPRIIYQEESQDDKKRFNIKNPNQPVPSIILCFVVREQEEMLFGEIKESKNGCPLDKRLGPMPKER